MSRIRELNDAFRQSFRGGRVLLTSGINALPSDVLSAVLCKVARFDDFSEDNDPYGEHDFLSFDLAGHRVFAKIDYYDKNMTAGSEDPADPAQTTRVLTIMLAEEY